METYLVLKDLAIIIIAAKVCGIIARKLHAPVPPRYTGFLSYYGTN